MICLYWLVLLCFCFILFYWVWLHDLHVCLFFFVLKIHGRSSKWSPAPLRAQELICSSGVQKQAPGELPKKSQIAQLVLLDQVATYFLGARTCASNFWPDMILFWGIFVVPFLCLLVVLAITITRANWRQIIIAPGKWYLILSDYKSQLTLHFQLSNPGLLQGRFRVWAPAEHASTKDTLQRSARQWTTSTAAFLKHTRSRVLTHTDSKPKGGFGLSC